MIPYVTAGDPALGSTETVLEALAAAGADLIEVGIPFSDPLADGPTIQRSCSRSLTQGTRVDHVLESIARVRARGVNVPIALLAYYNCVFRRGEEAFAQDAAAAGADGLIIPDLPVEEARSLRVHARAHGLDLVPLAAPTSTDVRLRAIGQVASGFIYCVSVTGVTGARDVLPETLPAFVQRVRSSTSESVPVAVGFGIATPAHARQVGRWADGVVVGSALMERMEQASLGAAAAGAAFVRELRRAVAGIRADAV